MICAGIDIGTNTALIVVADRSDDGTYVVIEESHAIPRLGEGLANSGMIGNDGFKRSLDAVRSFHNILQKHNVKHVKAVATSAMREASNATEVRQQLELELGYPIEVIDGVIEARMTFHGAVGKTAERTLMIDIGGGSTEYACGVNGIIDASLSSLVGAVRFTERYATISPIPQERIEEAQLAVREQIDLTLFLPFSIQRCVGVAGTPAALAMIDQHLSVYEVSRLEGYTMSQERIAELAATLCSMTTLELSAIPGIHQRRADIVPMGALILAESMRLLDLHHITTTTRGLRFGAMLEA